MSGDELRCRLIRADGMEDCSCAFCGSCDGPKVIIENQHEGSNRPAHL